MPNISILTRDGERTSFIADPQYSLMENLRHAGIGDISALCGGCCSCATCHVYVLQGSDHLNPPSAEENDMLDSCMSRQEHSRLACQIIINEQADGLLVEIAPEE